MAQSTSSQHKGALLYSSGQSIGFQWVTQRKATEEEQELLKDFPVEYFLITSSPKENQMSFKGKDEYLGEHCISITL